MFKIITIKRYKQLLADSNILSNVIDKTVKQPGTLNCGYKSCQFNTTDPRGLKIHRARMHRNK